MAQRVETLTGAPARWEPLHREAGDVGEWPLWEVRVSRQGLGPAPLRAVDVRARSAAHAQRLIEAASDRLVVVAVVPAHECEGCDTCRTYGGCGLAGPESRELRPGVEPLAWLRGLCPALVEGL